MACRTLSVALALLATGCSEGAPPDGGAAGPAPGTVGTPPVFGPDAGADGPAPLTSLNRSGVTGEVRITRTDGALVVVVEALRLPGEGDYAAYVFRGACASGGASVALLNPIVAGRDAAGTSTTILDLTEVPTGVPLSVQVRGPGDAHLACGSIGAVQP